MLQRAGEIEKGILHLEEAMDHTPQADLYARGNGVQLLARAYFKAERLPDFERTMEEALLIADRCKTPDNSVHGQFNIGTVYEEYGRSYGVHKQTKKAMEYLDKAQEAFAATWTTQKRDALLLTSRALTLVYGGYIREGTQVAVEATIHCKRYGNVRLLDRIYGVQNYLDQLTRDIGTGKSELNEVLYGEVDY